MSKPKRIHPGDGDPRHGTRNGYARLGCRGPDCTAAQMEYNRLHAASVPALGADELLATCWCEGSFVVVSRHEVKAGRTATCGGPGCAPPAGVVAA